MEAIMDIYGIVIFVVGLVGYLALRNRSAGWAALLAWVCGVGAGIFIGAIWATQIVTNILGS